MSDASTEAALREMSRTIGGLESTVENLVTTWRAQEATASAGRQALYTKFDTIQQQVGALNVKVDAAMKGLAEISPSVRAFEVARERAKGAQTLGKVLWAALISAGGLIGWMVAHWVKTGPPPSLH